MLPKKRYIITILLLSFFASALYVSHALAGEGDPHRTLNISPSTADAYARSDNPAENFGSATFVQMMGPDQTTNGFVTFDLNSIPAGSTILSARLRLCITMANSDHTINVHRVTSSWSETGLNWGNMPSFVETPSSSVTLNAHSSLGYYNWTITDDVRLIFSGAAVNYGWCITQNRGWSTVGSREAPDENTRPVFEITIQTPSGPTEPPDAEPTEDSGQFPIETVGYIAVPATIGGAAAAVYLLKYRHPPIKPSTPAPEPQTVTNAPATTTATSTTSSAATELAELQAQLARKQLYLKNLQSQLSSKQLEIMNLKVQLGGGSAPPTYPDNPAIVPKGSIPPPPPPPPGVTTASGSAGTAEDEIGIKLAKAEAEYARLQNLIKTTKQQISLLKEKIAALLSG